MGTHRNICPFFYGTYTITKVVCENYFVLKILPFLGVHPMLNVDLFWPYFPPLLDTSEVEEKLTLRDLNPESMEHASTDHIMDT
jgi:hypothetical protein